MSDTIEQTVAGRDTKPLKNWRKIIASSALPDETQQLIMQIVRRTRLWKRERASVAKELIAHFHDAADAGVAPNEAIQRFGDPIQSAKLIRRAKIRNRSYLWHIKRFMLRCMGLLILCYVGIGVYYYSGRPTKSVDFVAVLNERLPKAGMDQQAWPIYRGALLSIPGGPENYPDARPGEEKWPQMVEWLKKNRNLVEQLRIGTSKPVLGLPYSVEYGPEDQKLLGALLQQSARNGWRPGEESVAIYAIPQTNRIRIISILLTCDTHLALEENDRDRAQLNLNALLDLAAQIRHRDFLITDLVSMSVTAQAVFVFGQLLNASPDFFDDAFLVSYAHRLSTFRVPGDLVSFKGERILFQQALQNVYTDDGDGDGRITSGLSSHLFLSQQAVDPMDKDANAAQFERAAAVAIAPASLFVVASRKQMMERYDQSLSILESSLNRPYRETRESLQELWSGLAGSTSMRYIFADSAFPSLKRTFISSERLLAQIDAVIVVMAVQRWYREHGQYPGTLDVLVPSYLPKVTADRVNGQPIRYRLVEGKPIIYSVGSDGDDDGGRSPTNSKGESRPEWGTLWSDRDIDGDWVLFPPH